MKSKLIDDAKDYLVAIAGPVLYIFGVAGNSFVVIAVWKKRSLRSTTNCLLVNLAISDIVSFLFLPLMLVQSTPLNPDHFADFLCKFLISFHIPATANVVAILTVTLMSIERYHALVKPMKIRKRLQKDTIGHAVTGLWISGLLLTLPYYIFGQYDEDYLCCVVGKRTKGFIIYELIFLAVIVFVPFFITSFCYFQIVRELYFKNKVRPQNVPSAAEEDARDKRKLVKLSLSIISVFGLFMFPLFITLILKSIDDDTFKRYFQIAAAFFFVEAAVNPFIYTFQSTNFRQAFKEILKHPFCA
ncbi:somatostatin receptor type 5-like [Actinia tenebrosa]|uniref:Somatostatin receptor type 5-like n=1 Tax=Actinia tenebrosa TaxID=6105 RepID=A0A6P8H8N9_ACTTE|nr:somatostatin receptor type 5-like [Actinia tenebrosa]